MRVCPALFVGVTLLLAVSPALQAQMPAPTHFVTWDPIVPMSTLAIVMPDSVRAPANGSGMILGGITGMFAGYLVGAGLAAAIYNDGDGYDQLDAAIFGGLIAATFATPAGVHLGNRGRGSYLNDLLVSIAIGGVGIGIASSTDNAAWLLVLPIGQIIGSAWMEAHGMPKVAPADASQ